MRSIGKKNIKLVEKITKKRLSARKTSWGSWGDIRGIDNEVVQILPVDFWDIWEGADTEIRRIIDDTIHSEMM